MKYHYYKNFGVLMGVKVSSLLVSGSIFPWLCMSGSLWTDTKQKRLYLVEVEENVPAVYFVTLQL